VFYCIFTIFICPGITRRIGSIGTNEQYLLACFLLSKESQFEVVLPNTFISIDPELSQVLSPLWNDSAMHRGVARMACPSWLRVKEC